MKKINKFISMVLICLSIIGMSNFSAIKVKADTLPVQLCYAGFHDYYSGIAGWVYGYVKVKNLAYDKKITIHYSFNNGQWKDVEAEYFRSDNEGNEIWKFETSCDYLGKCFFAVKCEMNGQTYWDNNGGENYLVTSNKDAFGTEQVTLCNFDKKLTDDNKKIKQFSGNILLNNLGYEKDVRVRYTTDNWKTYKEKKAEYDKEWSSSKEYEIWDFSIDLDKPVENLKFAIVYKVNGQEYWDNDFGIDYIVKNN